MIGKQAVKLILISVFLLGAGGCQTSPADSVAVVEETSNQHVINWQINDFPLLPVPSVNDIFRLTEDQKQEFLAYYHSPENQDVEGHRRLYNYLESILDGFDYRGDTFGASEALQEHRGNCLSLAIVTTALAKLVNIDVKYQRVNTAPIYQRFHNVMTLSSHVRTHVYAPETKKTRNSIVLIRAKLVIDYFPDSNNVSGDFVEYEDFISMFYQNLAGDALVQKDFALAYSLLAKAMEVDGKNPETLNTLAVLHKGLKNLQKTEYLYKYAMAYTTGSVNVLSNYALLLEEQEREEELLALELQMADVNDDNPYRWYDIANRQFSKQKYGIALKYFKRSIDVAPYLHEGYFGLAKTYHQIGLKEQAVAAMEKAAELAFTPNDEFVYQAKLKVLTANDH
ncbi:hypothetical protein [Aliiglaciecola sp. M165]|uniref:hypothetical protein n=1 Tax=Aliiglaciecola sp. M165 TaxID=2593649 RepID=UPI00117DDBBE|nr:hypothetical protein [Aliiglaciecola sp. M165]TRY33770.1 hypothetical protein FM019_00480 [Aliiglaciecola sp. M165]